MAKYVLSYHGGMGEMPTDPKVVEEMTAAWGAWYGSIGAALVDGGAPFASHTSIGPDGSQKDNDAPEMSGYTVIDVSDLAAATEIAKGCPVLAGGSSVQISLCIDMEG